MRRNCILRCTNCHRCSTCCVEKDGRAFEKNARQCIACSNKALVLVCEACQEKQEAVAFDKDVLENSQRHGRHLVCLRCISHGFTPRDVNSYRCSECGDKGHMHFDRKALEHYKARGRRPALVCTVCTARHRAIEDTLRDNKALRCTCKGKAKDRVHSFSNEKCDLYPKKAGEQRWPGSNLKVSIDDWHFCTRMRRQREGTRH